MEGVFDKQATQMLFDSEKVSRGPGMYRLEKAQKENKPAFPWQEGVNFDFSSTFLENNIRVDAESELKNITRHLSNNPGDKYIPDETKELNPDMNIFKDMKDGFFHSESSRLNDPAFELKGMTKNRWISLKKDPQKTALEPFLRNGEDTYLDLIDNFKECKFQGFKK